MWPLRPGCQPTRALVEQSSFRVNSCMSCSLHCLENRQYGNLLERIDSIASRLLFLWTYRTVRTLEPPASEERGLEWCTSVVDPDIYMNARFRQPHSTNPSLPAYAVDNPQSARTNLCHQYMINPSNRIQGVYAVEFHTKYPNPPLESRHNSL